MRGISIEERAVSLAHYIIDSKDTVRGAAKKFDKKDNQSIILFLQFNLYFVMKKYKYCLNSIYMILYKCTEKTFNDIIKSNKYKILNN